MNIITFKYTKIDGKESERVLAVSAEPTKLYAGTDITSLEVSEQVLYADAINTAKETYLSMIKAINDSFDLNFNYRQFKPECMTNIVREAI